VSEAIRTIGYEGATVGAFTAALAQAGVELVLDIRAAPISRKKGFSKNQLAAHLAEAGIAYRHLRGLGTPKRGREAARAGDLETFEQVFREHMTGPEALLDLGEAIALPRAGNLPALPRAESRALSPIDRRQAHGRANRPGAAPSVRATCLTKPAGFMPYAASIRGI
jgi:uncharacterized protein (DUF488 family)